MLVQRAQCAWCTPAPPTDTPTLGVQQGRPGEESRHNPTSVCNDACPVQQGKLLLPRLLPPNNVFVAGSPLLGTNNTTRTHGTCVEVSPLLKHNTQAKSQHATNSNVHHCNTLFHGRMKLVDASCHQGDQSGGTVCTR
jgi:hypothetical protein